VEEQQKLKYHVFRSFWSLEKKQVMGLSQQQAFVVINNELDTKSKTTMLLL
jgi:hypothetical protein